MISDLADILITLLMDISDLFYSFVAGILRLFTSASGLSALASFIAALAALVGVIWGLIEAGENLKWKKISEAKKVRRELVENPKVLDAMNILDNDCNRLFKPEKGKPFRISNIGEITNILAKTGQLTETEIYINDCFETLFDFFCDIYKYVDKKILEADDGLVGYYLDIINKNAFAKYMKDYNFTDVQKLIAVYKAKSPEFFKS
jgi:hypothetical protein